MLWFKVCQLNDKFHSSQCRIYASEAFTKVSTWWGTPEQQSLGKTITQMDSETFCKSTPQDEMNLLSILSLLTKVQKVGYTQNAERSAF